MRVLALTVGLLTLALVWAGPLPERAQVSFAAHMLMHMGVVAVAAPLIAVGFAGTRWDALHRLPPVAAALPAALFELLVVWGWHAPALHDAARSSTDLRVLEQGSFLVAGLVVWLASIGAPARAGAGVVCLLLTSMHMTLLGSLLALAPRPLYACSQLCAAGATRTPLEDQSLGGVVMLTVGGLVYLVGGLAVMAGLLRERLATPASPGLHTGRAR
jgi:putative membrane protein